MNKGQYWTAVLLATTAAWVFGAAYYSILGKAWLAAQGKTKESIKAETAGKSAWAKIAPFFASYFAELVMAAVVWGLLFHSSMRGVWPGVIMGVLCWFGFVHMTIAVNNVYAFRDRRLTFIDSGHWLGVLVIIGAIVGWMGF